MTNHIKATLTPRIRDIGDFSVRRALPSARQPMVGPFVFFDHMGPALLPAGKGIDVRPHPHINLATITYLFEGDLMHHDSLDARQNIEPGAVNWMTAGRGITHSERSRDASRAVDQRIHGIQTWIALPAAEEECPPAFHHHAADTLPHWQQDGAQLRLIAGRAFGRESPVAVFSPMFYVDCNAHESGRIALDAAHTDRAVYVVSGSARIGEVTAAEGTMLILETGAPIDLHYVANTRLMLFGGEPMPEPRHIWWNFVSSRPERIEQAKRDWLEGRFAGVPGDDEFIPLPDHRQ